MSRSALIIESRKEKSRPTGYRTGMTLLMNLLIMSSLSLPGEMNEGQKQKAEQSHQNILTVDTHCDTPLNLLDGNFDIGKRNDFEKNRSRIDFPRMKEGGIDAIFMAVFVGQGPRTPAGNRQAKETALKIFQAIHAAIEKNRYQAELALTPDDAYRIEKKGKRAIYLGIENGYPIGKDLSLVKEYYDLGARYITLCHTQNNDICDSSTDEKGPEHNGLSEFGQRVTAEMNRLGMMIDVSHISDKALCDVLEISRAPVIASHSSSRAICDNPRNLSDDMLKKIAQRGGVVQACILSEYVKKARPNPARDEALRVLREKYKDYQSLSREERERARQEYYAIYKRYPRQLATVAEFVDHIDHIVKVAGIDHVGIGTDFDGGGGLKDCFDISQMGNITLELVSRGYSEEQVRKIWGGNIMRVFRQVEKIARELRKGK